MAEASVKVKGLNQLVRALNKVDKELAKEIRSEIREVAKVVQDDARSRFMGVDARSAMGLRASARGGRGFVGQRYKRTTGHHPEFGSLQMRKALLPALGSKQDEVVRRLEEMIDRLGNRAGF